MTIALLDAPVGFERALGALPAGATLRRDARGKAEIILLFVKSRAALERGFVDYKISAIGGASG